jgi:hypothetical protein
VAGDEPEPEFEHAARSVPTTATSAAFFSIPDRGVFIIDPS